MYSEIKIRKSFIITNFIATILFLLFLVIELLNIQLFGMYLEIIELFVIIFVICLILSITQLMFLVQALDKSPLK